MSDDNNDEGMQASAEGDASRIVADKPVSTHQRRKDPNQPNLTADDGVGDPDEGASEHIDAGDDGDPTNDDARGLVIFDFDGTLIEQDSLQMLVRTLIGDWIRAYALFLLAMCTAFWEAVATRREFMDYRSAFKTHWMMHTLKGARVDEIERIAEKMRGEIDWRDKLVHDMKECASKGYDVVVATGALDLYMKILLRDLPVTAMICAHAEVVEGVLTGRMKGPKEQCNPVRGEKRRRVQSYINERGPFSHIIGYGNLPHDGPMLALCDEFFVV